MRSNEGDEDVYNSLPIECFTNELTNSVSTGDLLSDVENLGLDDEDAESGSDLESLASSLEELDDAFRTQEERSLSLTPSERSTSLRTAPLVVSEPKPASLPVAAALRGEEDQSMWIRCSRCGKKNEIDSNFCGKCGLQIHKVVNITELVESATEAPLSKEAAENIKYHYKRPVFCFGPSGKCFAAFSSPSKSVRNMVKLRLSELADFKTLLAELQKIKTVVSDLSRPWKRPDFEDQDWRIHEGHVREICGIISDHAGFSIDPGLRKQLQEYFSRVIPQELGAIKILALQDIVSYSRSEIDQIFHQLVIGNAEEACRLCIEFSYWDHALIIAKSVGQEYYDGIVSNFLDSRFKLGHPMRILYLIMTNCEERALKEIDNVISEGGAHSFVRDTWTVMCCFLLRVQQGSSKLVATLCEDIGNALFKLENFEEALICYILAILFGCSCSRPEFCARVDYLLALVSQNLGHDTFSPSSVHIVKLLSSRMSSHFSPSLLWRCACLRVMYAQYLYDIDAFDKSSLLDLEAIVKEGRKHSNSFASMLEQEYEVLRARLQALDRVAEVSKHAGMIKSPTIQPAVQLYQAPHPASAPSDPALLDSRSPGTYSPPVLHQFARSLSESTAVDSGASTRAPSTVVADASVSFLDTPKQSKALESVAGSSPRSIRSADMTEDGMLGKLKKWLPVGSKPDLTQKGDNQKTTTKANLGKPSSFRYDAKLKKWVDDNDPSTFEEAPKLAPPPVQQTSALAPSTSSSNYRAGKGKAKYVDPLNPGF